MSSSNTGAGNNSEEDAEGSPEDAEGESDPEQAYPYATTSSTQGQYPPTSSATRSTPLSSPQAQGGFLPSSSQFGSQSSALPASSIAQSGYSPQRVQSSGLTSPSRTSYPSAASQGSDTVGAVASLTREGGSTSKSFQCVGNLQCSTLNAPFRICIQLKPQGSLQRRLIRLLPLWSIRRVEQPLQLSPSHPSRLRHKLCSPILRPRKAAGLLLPKSSSRVSRSGRLSVVRM